MNKNQTISFGDKFAAKLTNNNTDPFFDVGNDADDWSIEAIQDEGLVGIMIHAYGDDVDPKDVISNVLDNCVDSIESMVDTVDVFHLIAAHRDMPSLANAVPFELAEQVGYTYDEYVALCDEMDERINEVLETAIDQMIGLVAAENNCF